MSIHRPRLGLVPAFASGFGLLAAGCMAADAPDGEKITYQDHIRPLLENKCFSCHNPDKKKGDLDMTSFAALMSGGGGGAIVDPGNVAGSRIISTTTKKEEPYMPPEGDPLPSKDIELLSKWVAGGVLETSSSIARKSNKPKVSMEVAVTGKPEGPVAKPEHVLLEPVIVTPRTTAVTAMGASPWAPLIAMAGQKQILLYDTDTRQLAGIFPYPEGYARSVKFSRNGSLLIVGGGRGGKFGHAVVWDVKTGRRITEVGKEFDSVMCADISPNQKQIAIASPSKKIKVYDTATGEEQYVISKHTDWGMGCAFSPDGVLLATSDRGGNVMVWEADNGGEFFILGQHKASCTDLSWRGDGNVLASCSADGTVILWEMNEGKQLKSWAAHSGGVQSVSFTPDGRVLTCGNDGLTRLWTADGKQVAEAKSQGDFVTKVVALADGKSAVTANWRGEVKVWNIEKFTERGELSSNPPQIAQRIVQAEQRMAELTAKLPSLQDAIKKADADAKARSDAREKVRLEVAATEARSKSLPGEIAADEKSLAALKAARDKTVKDKDARNAAIKQYNERSAKIAAQEKDLAPIAALVATMPAADKAIADASAALEAAKKDPAQQPKVKELEAKLAAAKAELQKIAPNKAKADQLTAAIAKARTELGTAPAPVADLDKLIAETDAKIKATADGITAKKAELPKLPALVKAGPDRIKNAEAAVAAGAAALVAAQDAAKIASDEIGILQKVPTALKAAQFNTGVLAEKEKLAKLEADFNDFTAALKDNEEGKVASAARIVSSKKAVADSIAAQPGKDAALKKVQGELAVIEKNYEPVKAADTAATAKLEEQKKAVAAKEAEVAALAKAKDDAIAAAKKAADDITKQINVIKTQLADVTKKTVEPAKAVELRKTQLASADAELNVAKQAQAAAQKKAAEIRGATEAPLLKAKAEAEAAMKELAATKAVAIGKPDMAAKVSAAQQALDARTKAVAEAQKSFDAARPVIQQADAALAAATKPVAEKEKALATARQASDAAEKILAPVRGQMQNLQASVDAQQKALAEKQAAPAAVEKDTATKTQAANAAIAQLKAALPAFEKAVAEAHAKLDAETKVVDAKRAEVGKAMAEVEATKKQKLDAESAIAAAEKDIPNRDKAVAECKAEIAKLQPQLEPMRSKVRKLTEQYFTMLPK